MGFFKNKTSPSENRTLFVNQRQPEELGEPIKLPKYPDNKIKTSKYKIYNFPYKNLFEQFRRIANTYFLIVAVIQLSIDSPVSPWTSVLPLVFVIGVTAVKQGYEDWLRHKEDNKVNNVTARVLRDGEIVELKNKDIVVGDIVEVSGDEQFPADILLILSSDEEAKCDVTTANLDGETNLKTFFCPDGTQHLRTVEDLWNLSAVVETELPHGKLYDFKGRLDVYRGNGEPTKSSVSTDNLLLRGARLKNTSKIHGVAVYTGEETKMALNTKMTSNKFSTVEKQMNYYLIFFLAVLLVEVIVCTVLKYEVYSLTKEDSMWYIANMTFADGASAREIVQDSFSFLIIFNYIIPISLYVTLEVQKFLGILFLEWDDDIKCFETGERAKANTSDLNEELGQIQYLFTDKTGTLTENIMFFKHCSVSGDKYMTVDDELRYLDENYNSTHALPNLPTDLEAFLVTLALCHTARVATENKSARDETPLTPDGYEMSRMAFQYQAASPDEKALVEACAMFGVIFKRQFGNQLTIDVRGTKRTFTRLQVLEFDSDRKCMSVVVKEDATGSIWLLTKGAETSVLKKCKIDGARQQQIYNLTSKHIDDYAMLGLRTLAVARRELDPKLYEKYSQDLDKARQKLEGREEAVLDVMNEMESNLTLLGATGVEDLLQEGVQETLESLRVAGIKVWVLTGDKVETATNIAYSCGHFKRFMTILTLTGLKDVESATAALRKCENDSKTDAFYGLVVDGASLQILLDNLKSDFYLVSTRCTAVVCCRMSPRQKAETVRLIKKSTESPVCAAIGDGANDVSMIQEAHIGFGIMGKEGRQAVRCADFAFAKFRFLKKILLVHGHWYYVRVSTLVQYCFYKNVTFITPQIFYSIWNAFSTQSVYESLALTMYNITYTSLPVVIFGLFDQNLPPDLLMSRPHLYQANAKNTAMSWFSLFKWTAFGLWHTSVMYFGLMGVWLLDTPTFQEGEQPMDLYLFGTTLLNICVFVVTIKLMLEARYYTHFFFWSVVLSLVFYAAQNLLYQGIMSDLLENYEIYWSYYMMHTSGWLMLASVVLGIICLIPDLIAVACLSFTDERVMEKLRAKEKRSTLILNSYVGLLNEAFDPMEGNQSLWEVTKKTEEEGLKESHVREHNSKRPQQVTEKMSFDRQTVSTGKASLDSQGSLKNGHGSEVDSPTRSWSWQGDSVVI